MMLNELKEEEEEGTFNNVMSLIELKLRLKIVLIEIDNIYYDKFSINVLSKDIKARYMQQVINLIDSYPQLSKTDRDELFDFCSQSRTATKTCKCWGTTKASTFFMKANNEPSQYRDVLNYDPRTHELNKKNYEYEPYQYFNM